MRITVIGPTYPYKGGISHFTTILVQNLRKTHAVNFISWKRLYPSFLYPVKLKDEVSVRPVKTAAKYLLDFFNPFSWFSAVQDIKRNKSKVLIFTWIHPVQAPIYFVISLFAKKMTQVKIIYICHNVFPHERLPFDAFFIKLALNQPDSIIVHSQDEKEAVRNLIRKDNVTIAFLPTFPVLKTNTRYDAVKIKKELKLKKKVLLFFGYIRPYKGLKYLIKAMPQILKAYPDTSLLVAGEFWSKDRQYYLDLVKKLNVKNHVTFKDAYIPNEDLEMYFYISDVMVLPYVTATQSGVIQMAYSFNKPVISTAVGGLKDVVLDGKTGYVIKPRDSEDTADKVKLLKKPVLRSNIEDVKKRFSWERYIEILNKNLPMHQ